MENKYKLSNSNDDNEKGKKIPWIELCQLHTHSYAGWATFNICLKNVVILCFVYT